MNQTLQSSIDFLINLAKETNAEIMTSIDLQCNGGALLVVHWTGSGVEDLPLESHIYFSGDNKFQFAFVYDAKRWMWAVDEGLSSEIADNESRRVVDTLDDVASYLSNKQYSFVAKKT